MSQPTVQHIMRDGDHVLLADGLCLGSVTLVVEWAAGGAADQEQAGAACLAMQMVERGTRRRSRQAFHEALDALGADFGVTVTRVRTRVTLSCLEAEFAEAVDLVLEALLEPADDPEELRELRAETGEGIELQLEEPSGALDRVLSRALWRDDPWGTPVDGTPRSRGAVRVPMLRRARAAVFGHELRIGLASDEPDRLLPTLDRLHAALRAAAPRTRTLPRPPDIVFDGAIDAVAFPESDQVELRMFFEAPPAADADWPALQVCNAAFALGFSSPLPRVVRAEAGLSYVVDSRFEKDRDQSLLSFEVAPPAAEAARTVALALETARRFADELASLDPAPVRQQLASAHRIALETATQRLSTSLSLLRRGADPSDLWRVLERIHAVETQDLLRVLPKWGWVSGQARVVFAGGAGIDEPTWAERFPDWRQSAHELASLR